jgi:hypothetical protein
MADDEHTDVDDGVVEQQQKKTQASGGDRT